MTAILLQFFLSALTVVIAGSFLTKFSDKIAEITGWGRLFVGGLLLAAGTSLPELMVDIHAIKMDLPNLAAGDLLGSSLYNLLVLAVLDFSFPSAFRHTAFSPQNLHHSLSAVLTILVTAIVGIGISSRLDLAFLNIGIFSWAVLFVYLFGIRLIYKEQEKKDSPDSIQKGFLALLKTSQFWLAVFGYAISAAVILLAAPYLANAAGDFAKITGIGPTFIGTALLAFTTSLPELVSTFTAFRMGAPDLALGNIFGSNAFNMILFFALDVFHPGSLLSTVRPLHAVTAFCIVGAMSVAVMGQLYRKKERSRFSEPSSEFVVVLIVLFLYLLFKISH